MPTETDPPSPNGEPSPDDKINQAINSAVTAHLKRFAEKTLPTLLTTHLELALKPIQEKLSAAPSPEKDKDDEGGKKGKTKDPELAAALAQIEEFKSNLAKEREARTASETKARNDRAHGELKSALQSQVRPELLDVLADNLFHIRKVVEFEDDGTPIFRSKQKDAFGEEEDVRMPLKAGVTQFLKSEEAKAFIPAPGSAAAPPMKKTSVQQSQRTGPIDLSTASPDEKVRHAMAIAARAEAKT